MSGGRPTLYTPELLVKAKEYIDSCTDEMVGTVPKLKVRLPNKGGLARHLDVSRETLYAWAKEYPEFSDIMEQMGAKQEDALINNGISGDYNPTISKVLLTKHGYTDKTETDITSKGESLNDKPTTEQLALIRELENKIKNS